MLTDFRGATAPDYFPVPAPDYFPVPAPDYFPVPAPGEVFHQNYITTLHFIFERDSVTRLLHLIFFLSLN